MKDTRQVLPLADSARNSLQKIEAAQLPLQFSLRLPDPRQHAIERVRQQTELVTIRLRCPHSVVVMLRYRTYGLRKRENRPRDLFLQPRRQQVRDQAGECQHQPRNQAEAAKSLVDGAHV